MKIIKITLLIMAVSTLINCASGYKMIELKTIDYNNSDKNGNVELEYKYNLFNKRYAKKEKKRQTSSRKDY